MAPVERQQRKHVQDRQVDADQSQQSEIIATAHRLLRQRDNAHRAGQPLRAGDLDLAREHPADALDDEGEEATGGSSSITHGTRERGRDMVGGRLHPQIPGTVRLLFEGGRQLLLGARALDDESHLLARVLLDEATHRVPVGHRLAVQRQQLVPGL